MERPRFVHFAKLGSARTIYPRSNPASPASPCGGFGLAMAPLASSEPDIAGIGVKTSAPSQGEPPQTVSASPSSGSRVTLLREPIRRSGSTISYSDLDRGQSPLVTGVSTIPRLSEQRTQRHERSGSGSLIGEAAPRRYQRQNSIGNPGVYNRSAVTPQRPVYQQKGRESNTHKYAPSPASHPQAGSGSFGYPNKTRSPISPSASLQSGLAENQRQQKSSKTSESAIPRVTNTQPAVQNQLQSSPVSPHHSESQSSPLQIRKVLQSSPAFAQFQQKNAPPRNSKGISKLGKPNTAKTGSNPNFSNGLSYQEPTGKLQKYSYQSRTSSESSLASGDSTHIPSSKSVSNISKTFNSSNERLRYHRPESKAKNSSEISCQKTPKKKRPVHLSLKNDTGATSSENVAPSTLPTRRIARPSGQQAQTPPVSTPNGSQLPRGRQVSSQTPTKSKPKYYQRHPEAVKNGTYQSDQGGKNARTPINGTPRKSFLEKSKEVRYENKTSPPNVESTPTETYPNRKGPAHKQGFGFGFTCTANASIKRKQSNSKAGVKQDNKPTIPRAQTIGISRLGQISGKSFVKASSSKNDSTPGAQFEDFDDTSLDSSDFQGSWKRTSMRLATQGYSSMSDLTKSIDCLILDPDSQFSSLYSGDTEGDSLLSSDSFSSQNNTLTRDNKLCENIEQNDEDLRKNCDREAKEGSEILKSSLHEKSTVNSLQSNIQKQTQNLDSFSQAVHDVDKTPAQKPREQSHGIPIKQAYFADSSFILVPGVPDDSYDDNVSHQVSYPSPSGSPSSGYSSSPASRERRTTIDHNQYYEQQNHQNKIKRRSFVLATTSISDLSYYLDDVDTPKTGTLPSFVAINEVFHTPESQRRQPNSLTSQGSGNLNSSFGSYYSCQSQATPSPKLAPPVSSDDKRGSFYDNCQDSPKQKPRIQHVKDGYESEDSTPDSEYKTASSSSFVTRKDLNPTDRDDRIRAKLLSRHWVRNTPYRHSRFSPDQAASNYNRYRVHSPLTTGHQFLTPTDQCYAQNFSSNNSRDKISDDARKGKDKQKQLKKSPSPPESRKTPKKRMTSPIAWFTSSRTAENKRGRSPSADQRKRSNSSPFPNGRLSPAKSRDLPESVTSSAISQTRDEIGHHSQIYRCQAEAQYSADYRNAEILSMDSDSGDYFDAETDKWADPPRFPPSLGRPRRKEYAGFDSQPLPMDSFVSDSSSVYTDNTSTCSSRAPSRSADVESYSRRSSVASSTREFAACSRAFSSGASGVLTPRRQMSDDTICDDLSYQGRFTSSQYLEDDAFSDKEDKTLSNISIGEANISDLKASYPRSQSFSASKFTASETPGEFKKAYGSQDLSRQLRGCVSSQSHAPLNGVPATVNLPAKAQSCLVGRRPSDSSSRKSSTSGVSSDSYTEDVPAEVQLPQRHQHQQQQNSFKDSQPEAMTRSCPSKRKYFSSRDILELLITPEKGTVGTALTSLSTLEKQAQKVCRAILCCNSMNRSMPPGEFQL